MVCTAVAAATTSGGQYIQVEGPTLEELFALAGVWAEMVGVAVRGGTKREEISMMPETESAPRVRHYETWMASNVLRCCIDLRSRYKYGVASIGMMSGIENLVHVQ